VQAIGNDQRLPDKTIHKSVLSIRKRLTGASKLNANILISLLIKIYCWCLLLFIS